MKRVLVVGLGSIGQRHVRCLRALEGDALEILAWRQRGRQLEITADLEAREAVLEDLYGIRSFAALEDALAEGPEAALVCTPNHLHVPVALELAAAGLDLFLEKPVSHDLDGLDELARRLGERGRICCVGYQLRFHPGVERMQALLAAGGLGDVYGCHVDFGEYLPYWHRYEDYARTFMARAAQGGGVVLTQSHDLDLVLALLGQPAWVFASGGSTGSLAMDAEDHVGTLLHYPGDGRSRTASLDQDCLRHPPRRSLALRGTRGTLDLDLLAHRLVHVPFDGEPSLLWSDPGFRRDALFLAQMRHFLACLRGEATPRVDLEAGVAALRVALAVRESLATGRRVAP